MGCTKSLIVTKRTYLKTKKGEQLRCRLNYLYIAFKFYYEILESNRVVADKIALQNAIIVFIKGL